MSQPRPVPIHAPPSPALHSPTKSSLRRPSSGASVQSPTSLNTRGLLPSPHFADEPIIATHQPSQIRPTSSKDHPEIESSDHAVGDEESYTEDEHLGDHDQHPPTLPDSFQPFFTLIEDSVTNEHHHPTVHYIFADDDSDIISEAACRSLEVLDPSQRLQQGDKPISSQNQVAGNYTLDQDVDEDGNTIARLPPVVPGVREHYLILDVQPRPAPLPQISQTQSHGLAHMQGQSQSIQPSSSPAPVHPSTTPSQQINSAFSVVQATSLSAEWQVLRTRISTAPTIDDEDQDEGLMLRIEGRGDTPAGGGVASSGKDKERAKDRESMEDMIEQFQRRMDEIKQVLESAAGVDE